MTKKIPITVINLKKDIDRKNNITQQLNKLNLEFSLFEAIYGADLNLEEFEAAYNPKYSVEKNTRTLLKNDIGCALSHFGVYQKMMDNDIDKMLILEDDAIFDEGFLKALDVVECLPKNWEIFLLGYSSGRKIPCNFKVELENNHTTFNVGVSPITRGCLHGYVINKRGAQRMLNYKDSLYQAVDMYSGDYRMMNVYILYPKVVYQSADFDSSIGYEWMVGTDSKWKQQKIVKVIRNFNNKRRRKRQERGGFSLSCILRKIKFRVRHGFKEYYQ